MPRMLTGLQVFIASPGGLEPERRAFREVIDRVNHDHAHAVGITFVPRGWEYTSSGVGRPQSKINEHVKESDYLVVILWDQWGKPPGGGKFTSGTEEEYHTALECLQDRDRPMRDMVVLFKGVNKRQLADPGEGLKRVLAFKTELESSRVLLYSTFDTLDEFRDDFRQHLHAWVRDWQGDQPPAKKEPGKPISNAEKSTDSIPMPPTVDDSDGGSVSLAQRGKAAADRGRFTDAEQLFAQATTGPYDREAYTEYVRFLRKRGRLSLAQMTAHTFLEMSQDADDHVGEIEALANLAMLERMQGRNSSSLDYLSRALAVSEEVLATLPAEESDSRREALATKAFLLDNKSLTLRRIPDRSEDALAALGEARDVQVRLGDQRGAGFTLRNHGSLLLRLGRLDEAEVALVGSLQTFEDVGYSSGQATALGSLGELYEAKGEISRAIEMLDRSIAVTPNRSPSRIAMNYAILSRLYVALGDLDKARHFADYCMHAANELGTPESLATALHASAQVDFAAGEIPVAEQALQDSLAQFQQVDNPVGIAAVQMDLARVAIQRQDRASARERVNRAAELLERAPHYGLQIQLNEIAELLHGGQD